MRTARIPESVFELGLSAGALAVYAVFLLHRNRKTGSAWPDARTLSRMAGVCVDSLKRKLGELEAAGLIERIKKRRDNRNEYRVFRLEADSENAESDSQPDSHPDSAFAESDTPDQIRHLPEPDSAFADSSIIEEPTIRTNSVGFWNPSPEQKRLNRLFSRKDSTVWDDKERRAFVKISRNPDFTEELAQIESVYSAPIPTGTKDFRRRALAQLLNNWTGELDKCQNGGWRERLNGAATDSLFDRV